MNSLFLISTLWVVFGIILIFGIIFVSNPSTTWRKFVGWMLVLISVCGMLACYQTAEKLKKYEPSGGMEIPRTG